MNIARFLQRSAGLYGDRPALALDDQVIANYAAFARNAACLGQRLKDRFAIAPGDRIAICMSNRPDYSLIAFACWWVGAAIVAVNSKLHSREIRFILEDSGAKLCFGCPKTAPSLTGMETAATTLQQVIICDHGELQPLHATDPAGLTERSPNDLAWLFYTSGTTGQPKGAMISHGNLLSMTQAYFSDVDSVAPGAAILHMAPMSHGSGLYALPFVAAGGVQVMPGSGGFGENAFFDLLTRWPDTSLFAAPTMVSRLTASARTGNPDHRNLRTIVYGGGPLYLDDLRAASDVFGPKFAQIYGQGECPMTITSMSRRDMTSALATGDKDYLETVGAPFTGTEVRILADSGQVATTGETGEIAVRSATVMPGYWNNPEATAASIQEGWLRTGDLGALDSRGLLTLKGRAKELIVSAGTNIYPIEVENVLTSHPGVREAAVVGVRDHEWGERVVAFIVADSGADTTTLEQHLDEHCLAHIARFKRPKQYVFVPDMPKNAYGKIVKRQLLESKPELRNVDSQ
ncbi:MAG: AMP-binding protein [Rhodospirillales bacterium]